MESDTWIERCILHPEEKPEDWIVVSYNIGSRVFKVTQPKTPDILLDDPEVHKAQCKNDYMPYWGYLWPSAFFLAEHILASDLRSDLRVLEIGCGLGLAGIAALSRGMSVTFTDYTQAALSLAGYNARLNGFTHFDAKFLDWNDPWSGEYDMVLGADVLYENRCREDILRVLDACLKNKGTAFLSDAIRPPADSFAELAVSRGYEVREILAVSPHTKVKGRIFELWRK
jgi:predicted nicotinamide N-methyase